MTDTALIAVGMVATGVLLLRVVVWYSLRERVRRERDGA